MWGSSELLLVSCFVRQILVFTLRTIRKDRYLHAHEIVTFFPLVWTCFACFLVINDISPALAPGLTEVHLGLVFAPQVLTWFWCLNNREEISNNDLTLHVLSLAATIVLVLAGGQVGSIGAVCLSLFAFSRKSNCPRTRLSFFWLMILLVSFQKAVDVPFWINTWTLTLIEISMIFIAKFRFPMFFSFDKRLDELSTSDSNHSISELNSLSPKVLPLRSGPLISLESMASDESSVSGTGQTPPLSPKGEHRYDSFVKSEVITTNFMGRPHGVGHRRGVSAQSSGSGWAWGLAVQDFMAKSLSPPGSSDEESSDDLV